MNTSGIPASYLACAYCDNSTITLTDHNRPEELAERGWSFISMGGKSKFICEQCMEDILHHYATSLYPE